MNFFKNKINKYICISIIVLSVILLFFYSVIKKQNLEKSTDFANFPVSVHFIDVGQGDCELISCEGKNILIDGGEVNKGNIVSSYIKKFNISKLDYVIATHPHTDHYGGLIDVIKNFEVSNIIMPLLEESKLPTNSIYLNFVKNILDKKISVLNYKQGEVLNCGKGYLNFIGPADKQYENLNNYSIGFLFKYGNFSFLLCGDMEYEAENDLLKSGQKIKADVLKLNHHGSNTSNVIEFLKAVSPKYCVAEVGKNNPYGHPSVEVLKRLKKLKIKNFYRTDINGDIIFYTDGKKLEIFKQKE